MNIQDYSSEISISIFSQNVDLGSNIKFGLDKFGYQVHYFTDLHELIEFQNNEASHIVIFDVSTALMKADDFLMSCLKISPEIKFIFLGQTEQIISFRKLKEFNLSITLNVTDAALSYQILSACEIIAENILRTYQNEQLLEELESEKVKNQNLDETLTNERTAVSVRPYQLRISEYKQAQSKEELLTIFYKLTPKQSWIYLKYVPTIETFMCISFNQVPDAWVTGLSYKISHSEKQFLSRLMVGDLPTDFINYLKNKFEVDYIKSLPMIVRGEIEGLLISTQDISADVAEDFSLMGLAYSLFVIDTAPRVLSIQDPLTGFYNKLFYDNFLQREIERGRRLLTAVSVLKVLIDSSIELESTIGSESMEEVISQVALVLKETSRINDFVCRTDNFEFSIILTNCDRKGAAVRAERLKQAMQRAHLRFGGLLITVSQGISEYPSLASNAEEVNSSAFRALEFISKKGGDKICMSKASLNHQPDFQVES